MTRFSSKHGFGRKIGGRSENKKIWIFTDAEKTEPLYFISKKREIEKVLRSERIKIVSSKGRSTTNLINYALSYIKLNNVSRNDEYWIVFDKDDFDDFDEAIIEAQKNGLKVAYSNPCFELWYLLHFNLYKSTLSSGDAFSKINEILLKKIGTEYKKSFNGMYEFVKDYEKDAIRHAKKLIEEHKNIKLCSDKNPSTTVHLLVESLNSLMK